MTEKRKMLAGELYNAFDSELAAERERAMEMCAGFNNGGPFDELKQIFGNAGSGLVINPTYKCDYGRNIHFGDNVYVNYDCIMLDVCEIIIGHNVKIGPRVSIFTAAHPLDVKTRISGLEFGKKVMIGLNVWIGGGTVICPGVTIGGGSVIGAGSVVTRNIPRQVVAAGNPCRVIKRLDESEAEK
ncbi:MAG: sugar O-acetyltransferase [Desulfarculales bacterium]|jgi:maltose O-acetyltransferase|nr:sugar O-acetyltransferase [Desulfarculales bacterium]